MKKHRLVTVMFLIITNVATFNLTLPAQEDDFYCGTGFYEEEPSYQKGGRYLTEEGNLHVLIVYVQFPDDMYDTTNAKWPKNSPPSYKATFIDSSTSQNSQNGNLTHYFRVMSHK